MLPEFYGIRHTSLTYLYPFMNGALEILVIFDPLKYVHKPIPTSHYRQCYVHDLTHCQFISHFEAMI